MKFSEEEKPCGLRTGGRAGRVPGRMLKQMGLTRKHLSNGQKQERKRNRVLYKFQYRL